MRRFGRVRCMSTDKDTSLFDDADARDFLHAHSILSFGPCSTWTRIPFTPSCLLGSILSLIFLLVGERSDPFPERFKATQEPVRAAHYLLLVVVSSCRETLVLRGVISKFSREFEAVQKKRPCTCLQRGLQRFRAQWSR